MSKIDTMLIKPAHSVHGEIALPGDKSISHRAAMIAAIANGRTEITGFAESADCASTLGCMRQLGVDVRKDGSTVRINGSGLVGLSAPADPLDCGNSGTTMRLLAGILAACPFTSVMIGDESLSTRPMQRVIDPLSLMGAEITASGDKAPLEIRGSGQLKGLRHQLKIASAQIKSCILLAGLHSRGTTIVVEPTPARDHTERMLKWFGAELGSENNGELSIDGGQKLIARDLSIPGDVSSAAFFLVAAACLNGANIKLTNVGLNPTRSGILGVLTDIGVPLAIENEQIVCNEPVGDISIDQAEPNFRTDKQDRISGSIIANVIDEIPILAILGTQLPNGLEIRDAAELRVKESDRVASVVENLKQMGASVTEFPDGFRVERSNLRGAKVLSFGDHRIAMAFTIAGLLAAGETEVLGAECVDVSFPSFFDSLANVVKS